ncbi:MAG: type I glyceraldehyde-3-phosphate dehydrogenase [Peptoniphilaceae bacterium]|nr:type I glyceraldehyde-3-phosphate dehydrogenase [Peptoniphilaceae bacterium]MDY6085956.1 type I glyceraldehyde-3-phosphate dehydrogenase [Peptoniphilaceae bacterium]
MATKVAINGFGRIGRLALREILRNAPELEVVAINDLTDNEDLLYLLKYDTAQGRFPYEVTLEGDDMVVEGKHIHCYAEKDARDLPWAELGVDFVLECTGFYTSKEKSQAHIDAGAKRVLISAPAKGDLKMIVYGVNEKTLTDEDQIVSAASCTTNCLAPMADALHKEFGIDHAIMSTVHAYTSTQRMQDAPGGRKSRAGAANTIPATTGAAKAIGKVIPELNGRIDGSALRVPVISGSIVELYSVLNQKVTVDEVNAAVKKHESEWFKYTEDEIVSSDIIGYPAPSIFDASLTNIVEGSDGQQIVKTCSWYDNEMGFTSNMVRTLKYFAEVAK